VARRKQLKIKLVTREEVVEQLSKAHKHLIRNMGYVSDGTADAANMASYLGAVAQFLEYAQTGLRSVR
jgi:hypothetical protein